MALPPIIMTRQEITLVSPSDPVVETTEEYSACTDLDISKLAVGDDATRFVVRGLSPHERDLIGCIMGTEISDVRVSFVEQILHALRFGLVSTTLDVHTPAGAVPFADVAKRERVSGSHVEAWTAESIEAMDAGTRLFLGRAILSLSVVPEKKRDTSGSSPGKDDGTADPAAPTANGEQGLSIAASAPVTLDYAST
tara:strand:+ start:113 stop:700 length:588 start_codon:yes stop_codon:yes gene_type:complete